MEKYLIVIGTFCGIMITIKSIKYIYKKYFEVDETIENFNREIDQYAIRIPYTQEDIECCICLDNIKKKDSIRILPCLHKYHDLCILPWLLKTYKCPICLIDIR